MDIGLGHLAGYAREHGDANPPVRTVWLDWLVGIWVRELRKKKRLGALTAAQISDAERLGIDWNPPAGPRRRMAPHPTREQRREAQLHANLDRLVPYWHEHGHIDVLQLVGTEDWPQAGRFICRLRRLRLNGVLPTTVVNRATKMGIVWDPALGRRRKKRR